MSGSVARGAVNQARDDSRHRNFVNPFPLGGFVSFGLHGVQAKAAVIVPSGRLISLSRTWRRKRTATTGK
jgi:hypothetical protein